MDFSKLSTADKVIDGAAIALLIFMFLPWYGVDVPGVGDFNQTGWDYFLGGILPLIIALIMAAHVLISRFSPDTKLPELPVPWGQVHLIAGAAVAVILILRLLIASSEYEGIDTGQDLDRQVGMFLAVLAGLALAAGGYLKSKETEAAGPGTVEGPGTPPPAPF